MKPKYYLWIAFMALLSGLFVACEPEPEPEPEPPAYESSVVPGRAEDIQLYNKIIGTWVFCGASSHADVEPECTTPLYPHLIDTLVFNDTMCVRKTFYGEGSFYYTYTDTTMRYGLHQNTMHYEKRIKFRNRDAELLISDWTRVEEPSPVGSPSIYAWVCYHRID